LGDILYDDDGWEDEGSQQPVRRTMASRRQGTVQQARNGGGHHQMRRGLVMLQQGQSRGSAMVVLHRQHARAAASDGEGAAFYASFKRFVTFYITNFPPLASTFLLRKGFEVCGILDDVFIAHKRNIYGEVYGFVCYAKVRDVDKLLKALNNMCFGQYFVCAKLARFDKSVPKEVEEGKCRGGEGDGGAGRRDEESATVACTARNKEGEELDSVRCLSKEGEEAMVREGAVKVASKSEVRVGSVVVKLGEKECSARASVRGKNGTVTDKVASKKLVRCYRSCEEDLNWARRGMVGMVLHGESIPIIQKRVEDAGFKDIELIPLGADKVFVQSLSAVSASEIVREAKQFFDLIFASMVRWDKEAMPFQRGAWLRVYGIPLHAWNDFFLGYVLWIVAVSCARTLCR